MHRGNIPIIAGGTAFYISALKNGLPTVPAADFKAQAPLWEMVHLGKLSELKAELQELAPQDALRAGDNPRRVVRAVEVLRATGNPPSSFPFTTPKFALHIMALAPTIEVLEPRIHARAQGMFDAGFMQEVEALHSSWNVDDFSTARQAIGYKELFEVIEGKKTLEEAKEVIVLRTRQYAKRQLTFIRSMDGIELLPGTGDSQYATIEAAVTQLFSN